MNYYYSQFDSIFDDFIQGFHTNTGKTFENFQEVKERSSLQLPKYPHGDVFLSEDKSDLVFEFALAGYDKKKVKVSAGTNTITVKGEPSKVKSQNLIHRGVSRKEVNFSLSLDERLNPQKSKVNFENGMLSIEIPLREEAKEINLM